MFADVKAFTGARVFDGTGTTSIADAVIVVRDGKVEAAGPSSKVRPPKEAQIVNVAGKFPPTRRKIQSASSPFLRATVLPVYGVSGVRKGPHSMPASRKMYPRSTGHGSLFRAM